MKFQCEACERLVPLEAFRVETGALVVTCGRCGAESRARPAVPPADTAPMALGGTGPSAPPEPMPARVSSTALRVVPRPEVLARPEPSDEALFEPPPGHCPKCVAPRREATVACAQCGLVYANYLEHEHHPSDVLAGAWRELARQWEDAAAHERVMTLAMGRGELAMVGRLYRVRLARVPEDAVARRGRDEVVRRAAMAVPLAGERAPAQGSSSRAKGIAVGVLLLVMVVLLTFIFRHLGTMMAEP